MAPNEVYPPTYTAKKFKPGEEIYDEEGVKFYKLTTDPNYKHKYIPIAVVTFALLHAGAFYGIYLILTFRLKLLTFIWGTFYGLASSIGTILGAHRKFSHHAFEVTTLGKVLLIMLQSSTGQNNIYWWVRDHRLHHKFVDTDADPYNAKRGVFFSHIGWLMVYKHPLVSEKGKSIDMSDLEADEMIMFQKKYFIPMFLLFNMIVPMAVPMYLWNESAWICFFTVFLFRYVWILNSTWAINSLAHTYGTRPTDARISARNSKIGDYITFGDGWHNYHHVFPMHAALSEFGYSGGMATNVLYFMEKLGIAYDLKTASPSSVYKHSMRHGDGSIPAEEYRYKAD